MNKDKLVDLLIFPTSKDKDYISLEEYVKQMPEDQTSIYYACGETLDKIDLLPQVERFLSRQEVCQCFERRLKSRYRRREKSLRKNE